MLDGGNDYVRSSANGDEEYLTVFANDPHCQIRQVVTWGTRGKDGKGPYKQKLIRELSNNHIEAILETQHRLKGTWMGKIMVDEQVYRDRLVTGRVDDD